MPHFIAYVGAQSPSIPHVHQIKDIPTNRGVFHMLQREPIHHATITRIRFGVNTYHVAAFGFAINEDGTDPNVSHIRYSPNELARMLRDDEDGPTIYGPMVIVYSRDPEFIEATIKSVLDTTTGSAMNEETRTRVAKEFAIRKIDSNGVSWVHANEGRMLTWTEKKATEVAESLAKDHPDQHFEVVGVIN